MRGRTGRLAAALALGTAGLWGGPGAGARAGAGGGTNTGGGAGAGPTRVASSRRLRIGSGEAGMALSPDGRTLAVVMGPGDLCLYDTAGGERRRCAAFKPWMVLGSAAWSPDGRALAFAAENDGEAGRDEVGPGRMWDLFQTRADIWVLDATTMATRQLTRDEGGTALSHAPGWSPDGRVLAYARATLGGPEGLWLVPAGGGAGRPVAALPGAAGDLYVNAGIRWTPDGRLLYTLAGRGGAPDGLWAVGTNGRGERRLLAGQDEDRQLSLDGLTPDGRTALVGRPGLQTYGRWDRPGYSLVDTLTGRERAIVPPGPHYVGPTGATFSPDGRRLLYAYQTPRGQRRTPHLAVLDLAGGPGRALPYPGMAGDLFFGGDTGSVLGAPMAWGTDGTVSGMGGIGRMYQYLLTLR